MLSLLSLCWMTAVVGEAGTAQEGVPGAVGCNFPFDYSPTSTIAGLQKPYLLVGLFTLKSYIFIYIS